FSSSSLSAIAILNGRLMVGLTYQVCFSPLYAASFLIGISDTEFDAADRIVSIVRYFIESIGFEILDRLRVDW
ncbi:hypothetical protein, partial [Aulosira sp. FACHB-615]|uniref:hypothetical protein n=1 Tax=Aulosira sp. FACHB-615 TaxID=2692777 RepID=UPI001684ECE1